MPPKDDWTTRENYQNWNALCTGRPQRRGRLGLACGHWLGGSFNVPMCLWAVDIFIFKWGLLGLDVPMIPFGSRTGRPMDERVDELVVMILSGRKGNTTLPGPC